LVLEGGGLVHLQIERQLDGAKPVLLAGDVPGRREHLRERQILLIIGLQPVAVPGGRAVAADPAFVAGALERLEGQAQAPEEFGAWHLAELRLRIMDVVDVDAPDPQVPAAAVDLVGEIAGAMEWHPATISSEVRMPGLRNVSSTYARASPGRAPSKAR